MGRRRFFASGADASSGGTIVNKKLLLLAAAAVSTIGLARLVQAEPTTDTLEIDGKQMITRAPAPEGYPFKEVLSGWLFREAETRATEADSFSNPGMLAVERGEEIWNTVEGTMGKSCASCHNDASETMKDVGAHYPKWDADAKRPINVELQIDNFATPAELDGYFQSRAFRDNPVGVTYDPEEMCRRYEAGEPMASLLQIPPLPEGKTPWDMLSKH